MIQCWRVLKCKLPKHMFLLNGVFGMMSLLWANLIKITEGLTGLTCVETKSSVPNLAPRCRLKWCWCRKWHQSRECPSFYFLRELGSERCKSVWSVSFVFGAFGNRKASTKGMCLLSQLRAFYLLGALGFSNAFLMPWLEIHSLDTRMFLASINWPILEQAVTNLCAHKRF